jgi:hypothetical protein
MHVRTPSQAAATPHLGGYFAVALFILTLVAFVVESQLTQVRMLTPRVLSSI